MTKYLACLPLALGIPGAAMANTPIAVELDLLEMHINDDENHFLFDGAITLGQGPAYLDARAAGGSDIGPRLDELETQVLFARDVGGNATILIGARHDFREGADLTHASLGIEFAPAPWLEAESLIFLSQDSNVTGSTLLIAGFGLTDSLMFEPRLAIGWSAADIVAEDIGKGLTDVDISVRLRQQLLPFADGYIGVTHERLLGATRDMATARGERASASLLVVGVGFAL